MKMVCVWLNGVFIWLRAEISIILRVLYSAGRLTCAVIECGADFFVAPPWSWCTASNHGEDAVLITGTKVSSQTIPASVQLSAAVWGGRVAVKPDSVWRWCDTDKTFFSSQNIIIVEIMLTTCPVRPSADRGEHYTTVIGTAMLWWKALVKLSVVWNACLSEVLLILI